MTERKTEKSLLEEGWEVVETGLENYQIYEKGDERLLHRPLTETVLAKCEYRDAKPLSGLRDILTKPYSKDI